MDNIKISLIKNKDIQNLILEIRIKINNNIYSNNNCKFKNILNIMKVIVIVNIILNYIKSHN